MVASPLPYFLLRVTEGFWSALQFSKSLLRERLFVWLGLNFPSVFGDQGIFAVFWICGLWFNLFLLFSLFWGSYKNTNDFCSFLCLHLPSGVIDWCRMLLFSEDVVSLLPLFLQSIIEQDVLSCSGSGRESEGIFFCSEGCFSFSRTVSEPSITYIIFWKILRSSRCPSF